MDSEEKVAICVKEYGEIAEGQLKKKRSNEDWKKITDGELFRRSIFCSIPAGEEWKPKEYQEIKEMLELMWRADTEENQYVIEQNFRTLQETVGKEAVYLKLFYIASLGDRTKKNFIKAIIDVSHYKKMNIWAEEDMLNDLQEKIGLDWGGQLKSIFQKHFGNKYVGMAFVDEIFRTHADYIRNARNQKVLFDFFGDGDQRRVRIG